MALDGKILARAREQIGHTHANNVAEHYLRQEKIYSQIPEIHRIDDRLRAQMSELVGLTIKRSADLSDALKALGVTDVFDFDKSDFSPLIDEEKFDESVAVMRVQHAARVKIDEKGCEAAAFTAVRADAQSAAPEDLPVVEMDLNRPFAFMITGVDGLPLFLGTVNSL